MGRYIFVLFFVFVLNQAMLLSADISGSNNKKIFILHSYEMGHVCGQPQHNGIVKALTDAGFKDGKNLVVSTYYMDTKKKNNTPEKIDEQAKIAKEKIEQFSPDVLITLDDNAFAKVGLQFCGSSIPVVFCGLNGQPEDYNRLKKFMADRKKPSGNITGVYEKLHVSDAFRIHSMILPQINKIRIIVDGSPTGKAIEKQIKLELVDDKDLKVKWDMVKVATWEDYIREVDLANKDTQISSLYPVALLLKNKQGKTYTAVDILSWTARNSRKPELALNYFFAKLGLFGGAAVDFNSMGQQAGVQTAKILKGSKAGDLPIEDARRYALAFNIKRARELGINIPEDILLAADEIIK